MTKRTPRYCRNHATPDQIAAHLHRCDAFFIPALSSRVDIRHYATKLAAHAERFEAWSGGELVGLVAAYLNAADFERGFITNVSVAPEYFGQGVAAELLEHCRRHARTLGFARLQLEVAPANLKALERYLRQGYRLQHQSDESTTLHLPLDEEIR